MVDGVTDSVTDNQADSQLELLVDGHTARIEYHLEPGRLVLDHTVVPDELGGRGLGGVLVRAALRRAEDEGLDLVPVCPFARSWLEKHPDDAARVRVVEPG